MKSDSLPLASDACMRGSAVLVGWMVASQKALLYSFIKKQGSDIAKKAKIIILTDR